MSRVTVAHVRTSVIANSTQAVRQGPRHAATVRQVHFSGVSVGWPASDARNRGVTFGAFHLLPEQKLLLEAGREVRLGSRSLEVLIALIEHAGQILSKAELTAIVWPNTFVDEANLRVHIGALRKALRDGQEGKRFIVNVPSRGYTFVAPVTAADDTDQRAALTGARSRSRNDLPSLLTRIVGRDDAIDTIATQISRHRFVTIVGVGGMGKTTVALAVAERVAHEYTGGAYIVDLSALEDRNLVVSVTASAIGVPVQSQNPLPGLIAFLREQNALLVLDTCEHLIEDCAALAEDLLKGAPRLHVLATSREPLRAEGERVFRLPSLGVPPQQEDMSAEQALQFSSVELFAERATANFDAFELDDAIAPIVAGICRRLDGIPLAIEMAAGQVNILGVRGLAKHLGDALLLLTQGRRTALPRHQTLGATLDWSHELLPDSERIVFRRFAVFVGDFAAEAAVVVASVNEIAEADVLSMIASLVAKSLLVARIEDDIVRYRLLDTTRAYAHRKLVDSGELGACARRHAEFYRDLFESAEMEVETRSKNEWLALYGWLIDNVRAALDWAFLPGGDPQLGVALTAASIPLWTLHGLTVECRWRIQRAIAAIETETDMNPRDQMRLNAALGWCLDPTKGPIPEAAAAWRRALDAAERLDDGDYQLRVLWGLWVYSMDVGEALEAYRLARRFIEVATRTGDGADVAVGDRLMSISLHYGGDQPAAREHIDRMLLNYVKPRSALHNVRFHHDQMALARVTLARILWLQGFSEQATKAMRIALTEVRSPELGPSLLHVIAEAALFIGDLETAEECVPTLLDVSSRTGLHRWHALGCCLQAILHIKRGDPTTGVPLLRSALDTVVSSGFTRDYSTFLGVMAEGLGRIDEVAPARAAVEEAIRRCEQTEQLLCLPELLRIRGELELYEGTPEALTAAEDSFLRALDQARAQSALAWELRAATSLARLRHNHGRNHEALAALAPVYARFREGFDTADLIQAHTLLTALKAS
ncbi:winged helix-turn-helix domain-containing protein [Mesorhizobium sp. VK9D]|uniref:ATP-binding protein n=1 Tax=Mesorhizobium australafricanum TaxID=3072311 RepID=UPI002A245D22|nr:winged helix-turn-helix domain-containing protein [Mesorhizobium sp. VK9D]MDX8457007.1 winged helix-turn-helix domain-containing protein [Mesorhizobium sp. VK9D]